MLTPQEESIENAWRALGPSEREHLVNSFRRLAQHHNKKLSEDSLFWYAKRLSPWAKGERLYQTIPMLMEEDRMPTIKRIKEALGGRPEQSPAPTVPALTPEEEKRSDHAAIMSMLWLHYEKGWRASDLAGAIFERQLGVETARALVAAAEIYDRETVARWMRVQELEDESRQPGNGMQRGADRGGGFR